MVLDRSWQRREAGCLVIVARIAGESTMLRPMSDSARPSETSIVRLTEFARGGG